MNVTYAPLNQFPWHNGDLQLGVGVSIIKRGGVDFHEDYSEYLADWWVFETAGAYYSLRVEEENFLRLRPSAIVQLFLFALWLVHRTTTHVNVKFFEEGGTPDAGKSFSVHLDRFQWNKLDGQSTLASSDLDETTRLLIALAEMEGQQSRLRFAVHLALRGCESVHWTVAALLHISALEALLSYSRKRGITGRFARSCACLVEDELAERQSAHATFRTVYNLRSDLVHGRGHLHRDSDQNLQQFHEVHATAQKLWRKVLLDPEVRTELGKDDDGRRAYLEQVTQDFHPTQGSLDFED